MTMKFPTRFLFRLIPLPVAGALAIALLLLASNGSRCDEGKPEEVQRHPAPDRLVAIGDTHGAMLALRPALVKAEAINDKDEWVGGKLVVVITGDFLDRGPDEIDMMALLEKLRTEAAEAGGALHVMNGNHEVMNVQGRFYGVTPAGFNSFKKLLGDKVDVSGPAVKKFPPVQRWRAAAFKPGGLYAKKLSRYPFVLIIGDTVFVHGGLHPDHVRYGIGRMNRELQEWMAGKTDSVAESLVDRSSAIWLRDYSDDPDEEDCARLEEALSLLKVKRMVVGHTIQPGINSSCDGKVWKIDSGMNPNFFGGPVEVLEIKGDEIKVIR